MSHAGFGRADTGIHTVEGTLAGRRAAMLADKREKDQQAFEAKKRKIQEEAERSAGGIGQKFTSIAHDAFKLDFVGLKTKEEFQSLRDAHEEQLQKQSKQEDEEEARRREREEKRKKKAKESKVARLSFAYGDEDGEAEEEDEDDSGPGVGPSAGGKKSGNGGSSLFKKKKLLKNPEAETSFLPDPDRERAEQELREKLKLEWLAEQERVQNEMLEVTYSYWDGSGHRRVLKCKKGTTVAKFLELVRAQVAAEFTELRAISADDLMYIKEDLIIPHNYSFYDLIVTKARGKSGPLFHFDVHDDVRMTIDTRIEKDESHPGKVVDRKWYERNKHIFPASRWEVYDPKVERGGYTVHGQEVVKKK